MKRNNLTKKLNIMSKRKQEERQLNAKQKAYEKKEAAKAEKVIKWIFGILIACAIFFCAYSVVLAM
jgi:hypothetical protein